MQDKAKHVEGSYHKIDKGTRQTDITFQSAEKVRTPIRVLQMDCLTEETLLRKELSDLPFVHDLQFNLVQGILTIIHDEGALERIQEVIRSLGLTSEILHMEKRNSTHVEEPKKQRGFLIASCFLAFASELFHWLAMSEWLSLFFSVTAIMACGLTTYKKGWIALRHRILNINALMSIAVTGAFLIGRWPEAAMVMVLFTIAEAIESGSIQRACNAIQELVQLTPDKAVVKRDDASWVEIPVDRVIRGMIIRVKPGEKIALDGEIVSGYSSVNQAPITGESIPVEKEPGDKIFAGTINESGSFEYRVTATSKDTTLARIIHAVKEAQGARAPTQRFVDRFAAVYTPVVCLTAVFIAFLPPLLLSVSWYQWIYNALVLLIIACPCALVISTPVTIVSGLTVAAKRGILIKGGAFLEMGHKLSWLALDKTGTITRGRPQQTDFKSLTNLKADECWMLAASLAARSSHPVSLAIVRHAQIENIAVMEVEQFQALPGFGVKGTIEGEAYRLGNHSLIEKCGLCSEGLEKDLFSFEEQGKTVVALFNSRQVLALFAVADTVKISSRVAIARLKKLGVKIAMLTGDNQHVATTIAQQVGITSATGHQYPKDKLKAIELVSNAGIITGMVGDGINDVPALARADIGFAMGAMGSGAAIETADVTLIDDDLRKIPLFIVISRKTHAILLQNITIALGLKIVFFVLTICSVGTMWMAIFADLGASLLVVGNGLRLLHMSDTA